MMYLPRRSAGTPVGLSGNLAGGRVRPRSNGLTLVEMLVSLAITLMLLFAIVTIFKWMGDGVNSGRATIDLSSQLRQATNLLQQDLDGLTVQTQPWAYDERTPGYFEYIEGPTYDTEGDLDPKFATTSDIDDVLAFTSRRKGKPFVGPSATGRLLESEVAEIIWFCYNPVTPVTQTNATSDPPVTTNLYRVVVPVRPDPNPNLQRPDFQRIDRLRPAGYTLEELSRRNNRFLHIRRPKSANPSSDDDYLRVHELNIDISDAYPSNIRANYPQLKTFVSPQNLVLANVLSWDVRIYHPTLMEKNGGKATPIGPEHPDYGGTDLRRGAYVDLGYLKTSRSVYPAPALPDPTFQYNPDPRCLLKYATWDTWPYYYEHDGENQDEALDTMIDEGTNGLDDDSLNGADDPSERETAPPYPFPMRGLQVRFRIMEPDSGMIRQVTMVADFVPG